MKSPSFKRVALNGRFERADQFWVIAEPRALPATRSWNGMLEKATGFEPNVVQGRFMIPVRHLQHPWIVIVEPDADAKLLVVVTVYDVSND